jgi:hypothetical protein
VDAAASLCGCKRNPELVMASWHGRLCKPGPGRANLGLGPGLKTWALGISKKPELGFSCLDYIARRLFAKKVRLVEWKHRPGEFGYFQ